MFKKFLLDIEVFVGRIFEWIPKILDVQIFTIDKNPITVGKLILGIATLLLGQYLVRKLSIQIDKRILTRLDIEPPFRHTMETFIFYFLFLFLILFVLKLLNIPVTVFTIVGGALAVAIGLGAQNIVYDFLSGIIIILEHPVRVGDLVEVENIQGRVEDIGARATRVETHDNKHVIVPNNFFLSKAVLNWTLSNETIRGEFQVGVQYGSDTQKVSKFILQATEEHPKVRKKPAPFVLFSDFGNSALIFKISFWANIRTLMDMRKIKSELRFKIDQLFRENGIVIAFPQRDLHVKNFTDSLKVEILPKGK